MITDAVQRKCLALVPAMKIAVVGETTGQTSGKGPNDFLLMLRGRRDGSEEDLGKRELDDGQIAHGFHMKQGSKDWTVWADPESGLPIRVELSWGVFGAMTIVMSDFAFNIPVDESLFSLEPPEGYTIHKIQFDSTDPREADLLETLGAYSDCLGGSFPPTFDFQGLTEELEKHFKKGLEEKKGVQRLLEKVRSGIEFGGLVGKLMRGLMFADQLPAGSDWNYVGKDIKRGESDRPVCWWRPDDSETYRVVYGDLTVRDVKPEDLPTVPEP